MKWYVSRQAYYYSRLSMVEIAAGGLDYSGSDMLVAKYPRLGEGEEYADLHEAVEAAIAIARAWRKDEPGKRIVIGHGNTMGMGLEFESCSFKDALKWAKETYEKLPKCEQCGEPLPDEREYYTDEFGEAKLCSEHCAERWAEEIERLNREDADGEDSHGSEPQAA